MTVDLTDALTGLPGRAAFDSQVKRAIADTGSGALSIALVDVDKFMLFNDEFGHAGGDAVLKAVAQELARIPGATALRYGGDEFVVLFANTEREQAFLKLEKAREIIAAIESLEIAGKKTALRISISAGIAAYPIDGMNESELLRKADGALYRAKGAGRGRVTLAYEERMAPKTAHFTLTQLERLAELSKDQGIGEAVLLREALDDLLVKYIHSFQHH